LLFGVSCCSQRGRECSNGVSAVDEGEECAACDCWVADCEGCACCCMLQFCLCLLHVLFVELRLMKKRPFGGEKSVCDARCCRNGWAPIYFAASDGHFSCLEFLVARNADVNAQTE
jgi:hypothetical protein